ncbi:hypothetical protein [Roseobacter weihaiensis]|uniref:hypothetical protein n=1 Tax=Roseobacter weihaiensis TaxID=2763262 RepID=UPI001D0B845F|nr:hypothetical protein [Roseobacter sp. H9]
MAQKTDIVLVLGSGPNAKEAATLDRASFDRIVAINNAWQVRADWDDLIYPEDFPAARRPTCRQPTQRFIEADQFVPTQNAYGGFVYAGGTMAFTAGYWVLHALRPKVMAFLGCDMVYPKSGPTHFYGTGTADPLRPDITLQDLGAKSARLGLMAATQGCRCVNLSTAASELLFERVNPAHLRDLPGDVPDTTAMAVPLQQEEELKYFVPTGRYWEEEARFDPAALARLDVAWRAAWSGATGASCAA